MDARINLGSRVYIRIAVAGVPGVVSGFKGGKVLVDWSADMPEIGRWTAHDPESLIVDEAFTVKQLGLAFEEVAA
jgi:hypothetical protein